MPYDDKYRIIKNTIFEDETNKDVMDYALSMETKLRQAEVIHGKRGVEDTELAKRNIPTQGKTFLNKKFTPYNFKKYKDDEKVIIDEDYVPIELLFLHKTPENPSGVIVWRDIFPYVVNMFSDEPENEENITLEELLTYLKIELKVKNVLLIDFSCQTFVYDDDDNTPRLSPEEESAQIAYLNKNHLHGGKKQLLRPRKSRKSTPRRCRRQGRRTKKAIRKRT